MQSLENRDFENKWRDAFADAEDEPNEALWLSIENSLAATDGMVLRGRVVFYQRLAAASLLVAILLGGLSIVKWNSAEKSTLASSEQKGNTKADANEQKTSGNQSNTSSANNSITGKAGKPITSKTKGQNLLADNQRGTNGQATLIQVEAKETNDKADATQHFSDPKNSTKHIDREVKLNNAFAYYDIKLKGEPVFDRRTRDKIVLSEPILSVEENKEEDNWWAAIGGSAGAYSQQASLNGGMAGNLSSSTPASRSQSSTSSNAGSSFSVGMAMGKKISKRWTIMTGVNYLTQSVGYSSNQAINGNQAFLADLSSQKNVSNAASNFTSSYNVNSVNEFVSIPLQAGYQIVQRKFGLQLNTGIASDIFVRNSLVDPSGKLATYTEAAGENSAYQNINWTGLLGTELSYKISSQYRFSLVPGMRYSFQSIVKPTVGSTINPLVWDVGFRLRYNFK